MIRTPQVPTLADPKLIDLALLELQTGLTERLSWLNQAFGKAETRRAVKYGRTYTYPAVHVGKENYLNLMPDGHIGNYSFFAVDERGKNVTPIGGPHSLVRVPVSLILWWDYRSVYGDNADLYNATNVVSTVIEQFNRINTRRCSYSVKGWTVDAREIYKGYTDTDYYQGSQSREVRQQFLMRPYGGCRINFVLRYNDLNLC